jgi:hypothetical protein
MMPIAHSGVNKTLGPYQGQIAADTAASITVVARASRADEDWILIILISRAGERRLLLARWKSR